MKETYFCWRCKRNHWHPLYHESKIGEAHFNAENVLTIPPKLIDAVGKACMDYQMNIDELTNMYVKRGLKKDGFEVGE